MLPVATPPNAIVFASERIKIRDMAFAGMWFGQKIRMNLSQAVFSKGVFVFLIIVGANLIRKGIV